MSGYHAPVLVDEVVRLLRPERGGLYLDGTVGGGGHSEAILRAGREAGARVIGVDRDPEALAEAAERLSEHAARFEGRRGNFADEAERPGEELAGAVLDLGVSSHQIDSTERGFSFRPGSPLDMRMGVEVWLTAADVLNRYEEDELVRVLREYGEEPRARPIARRVVGRREERPFHTSDDLKEVLDEVYGRGLTVQDQARIHQALRIEVNGELEALDRALPALRERLLPGGVLVVIAYHSLEDRRVKNAFREWSRACVCPPELPVCVCRGAPLGETLTRKPVRPTAEELERNPRSRSARLRGWRKAA
ncbi:MAG TPA: 16S rRNA (cytosine(1402)-N(4))-methyltransferase RsmH [Longimicrobiales bacterium]|nr:16S rRNA (cytosine(1402)-N(4))-methyltransferase RsmH [Longimicrobiales bacterium]